MVAGRPVTWPAGHSNKSYLCAVKSGVMMMMIMMSLQSSSHFLFVPTQRSISILYSQITALAARADNSRYKYGGDAGAAAGPGVRYSLSHIPHAYKQTHNP